MNCDVESFEKAIAHVNQEYQEILSSKEYVLGKKILKLAHLIKARDFAGICKALSKKRKQKKYDKQFIDLKQINGDSNERDQFYQMESDADYTVTVYMCVVGRYDSPNPPLLQYRNYRFVLFTDKTDIEVAGWEVREIPIKLKNNDATYINRYIKFHPWEFFDTDYTFYIDGNVKLLTGISSFIRNCLGPSGIAMFDHPERDCLYREAESCLFLGKGNSDRIKEQVARYRVQGMPPNYGLKEATVILIDHTNPEAKRILIEWWEEYLRSESRRDQLAFPYVIWKNGKQMSQIGTLGTNIRKDNRMRIEYHTL